MFNWLKKFFSWFTSSQAEKIARQIQEVYTVALPLVKMIAAATPTRVDDEIVALFERFGVPNVDKYLALPQDQRGTALLTVATTALQASFPQLPMNIIQSGIQLAVTAMKGGVQ